MDDRQVIARIDELVAEEHALRARAGGLGAEERERLAELERGLDQCWDLLRQRRAREDAGTNPDDAKARPTGQVESYLQ